MTWFLLLVWCEGIATASCSTVFVPTAYVERNDCDTAGKRAINQQFSRYICVQK